MTTREERNRELARRWAATWNEDAERMVDECYAPDCEVLDVVRGTALHGREELRAMERKIVATDPTRRMEILKLVADGDSVAVEVGSYWRDDSIVARACVVLTFDDDGLVASDHTYSGDPVGVTSTG